MARIRTIKPEFWTHEILTECSMSSRLLLIGLLNFADDNGNLYRSPKKIKMQIFPAENIDCEPLLLEMIAHGILMEYSCSGQDYLCIVDFKNPESPLYQVINRKSKCVIPPHVAISKVPNIDENHGVLTDNSPPIHDISPHTPGVLIEDSAREGKGRERSILLSKKEDNNITRAPDAHVDHLENLIVSDMDDFLIQQETRGSPITVDVGHELERFKSTYRPHGGRDTHGKPVPCWKSKFERWLLDENVRKRPARISTSPPEAEKKMDKTTFIALQKKRDKGAVLTASEEAFTTAYLAENVASMPVEKTHDAIPCSCGNHFGMGALTAEKRAESYAFTRSLGVVKMEQVRWLESYEKVHGVIEIKRKNLPLEVVKNG